MQKPEKSRRKRVNKDKPSKRRFNSDKPKRFKPKFKRDDDQESSDRKPFKKGSKFSYKKKFSGRPKGKSTPQFKEEVRLNRYIANAGICSRREADKLISDGLISINGKVVTELWTKVQPGDTVKYAGEKLSNEKNVYILMNKPKNTITTVSDERSRITVIDLLQGKVKERVYPVGRLDRDTTGLLVITNDGNLAKKLTHPRFGIKKTYAVEVDKVIKPEQIEKLKNGFNLDDGFTQVDDADYDSKDTSKKKIIIELHSGKNRIVRRMMEHLGFRVKKLDRISFAGLTKNALTRGKWRFLTPKEVGFLMKTSAEK
jgi:23S rRNA pseudouridine2605 synthase